MSDGTSSIVPRDSETFQSPSPSDESLGYFLLPSGLVRLPFHRKQRRTSFSPWSGLGRGTCAGGGVFLRRPFVLALVAWNLFGIWNLRFGACSTTGRAQKELTLPWPWCGSGGGLTPLKRPGFRLLTGVPAGQNAVEMDAEPGLSGPHRDEPQKNVQKNLKKS